MELRTPRGGRKLLALPPTTPRKLLETARQGHAKLQEELREVDQRLERLALEREGAIKADRVALAHALREGKEEPDDRSVQKVDKAIAAAVRRREALELALDDSEQELVALVAEHRDTWVGEQEQAVAAVHAKLQSALAGYLAARNELSEARALARWVAGFPETSPTYRPVDPPVTGLKRANGEPFFWPEVAAALSTDAEPPSPTAETYVPWGRAADEALGGVVTRP